MKKTKKTDSDVLLDMIVSLAEAHMKLAEFVYNNCGNLSEQQQKDAIARFETVREMLEHVNQLRGR